MGLFDIPAPLFSWLDARLAGLLPELIRLMLWGALGGAVSMWLYKTLSPQSRIAAGKRQLLEARRELDAFDGEFADAGPMIGHLLRTAFVQVGRVAGPAVLASLPLLALLAWISTAYGHAWPAPDSAPEIHTSPPLQADWRDGPGAPHVRIANTDGQVIADVQLEAPVPVVHKRRWWNALLGNPAGYLPANGPLEWVRVELPAKTYLPVGPGWARGWELTFFLSLLVVSLVLKKVARIE